jgi:hypothetical protein
MGYALAVLLILCWYSGHTMAHRRHHRRREHHHQSLGVRLTLTREENGMATLQVTFDATTNPDTTKRVASITDGTNTLTAECDVAAGGVIAVPLPSPTTVVVGADVPVTVTSFNGDVPCATPATGTVTVGGAVPANPDMVTLAVSNA